MAIISQGLELMKPDYFHYLPLRWRQRWRAGTQVGAIASGPLATREPPVQGAKQPAWSGDSDAQAHDEQRQMLTENITGDRQLGRAAGGGDLQAVQVQEQPRGIRACTKRTE